MRGLVAVLLVVCLLVSAPAAMAGTRVALVIGNTVYANAAPLPTAAGDARDMADSLRKAGFEVLEGRDVTRESINRLLLVFADKATFADVALLYFAGYAIAVDGKNYLLPVDANPGSGKDVPTQTVDVERAILDAMAGAKAKLVFLDTTPGNPFPSNLRASVSPGLAPITTGKGTFMAFATAPGAKASGKTKDRNSLFTSALLSNLRIPDLNVEEAVNRSRVQVARDSGGEQIPWIFSSLTEDIYLSPANAGGSSPAAKTAGLEPPPMVTTMPPSASPPPSPPPSPPQASASDVAPHVVKTVRIKPDVPSATTEPPATSPVAQPGPAQTAAAQMSQTPAATSAQSPISSPAPATDDEKAAQKKAFIEKLRSRQTRALHEDQLETVSKDIPVLSTGDLPDFPWPPPKASASYVLPDQLLKTNSTLADVVNAILSALERTGYVERSFFKTPPGGIALVTRLERIEPDGTPFIDRNRWAVDQTSYQSSADMMKFLRGLFFVDPGHYRLIVFVLQDAPIVQSTVKLAGSDARGMISRGADILPAETGKRSFSGSHCTVLVYEFASDGKAVHMVESQLTGKQHLDKAGVLASLAKAN